MFSYTKSECTTLCNQAIELAWFDKDQKYLEKEWRNTPQQWTMFARQHSQILWQVTTTNPLEVKHEKLEGSTGLVKGETCKNGILGCICTVHDCAHDIDNKAKKSQLDKQILQTSLTKRYPLLVNFPYAVQGLMSIQESNLNSRIQDRKTVVDFEFINSIYISSCQFFHRYQLPYHYIFQKD